MSSPHRSLSDRIRNSSADLAVVATLDPQHRKLIQDSHERCAALGLSRIDRPEHQRLIRSDLSVARERNQRLCTHAAPVMEMLAEQIAGTESMIVLCDAHGTVLHAVGDDSFLERASTVALAPGANWAEQSKGTNAIGTALFEERPTLVHADDHFMHANSFLTCSAVPIFDPRGSVLGVLDATGDHRSYHRHTMGLVRMSARMIENHWLSDACGDRLRLHFHSRVEFIGTLLEGILVVGGDGRFLGANRSAIDLLGLSGITLRSQTLQSLLGTTPAAVIDHFRTPMPMPMELALPDGRRLHFGARFHWTPRPVMITPVTPAEEVPDLRRPPDDAAPASTAASAPTHAAPHGPGVPRLEQIAFGDARIEAAVHKLRRVIDRDVPLLVVGEAGTGKEFLARAAHAASRRAASPFVAVQCQGQPGEVLEAELFGSMGLLRPGSRGAIARATGGTLFLADVDTLSPSLQARLLGTLQARRDDGRPRLDIALACTTRIDLRDAIAAGRFREDLYFRINGLTLRMPPLRERSDIEPLARHVLEIEAAGGAARLSEPVIELLRRYRWPGNVRQLTSVLRTAALLAGNGIDIRQEHLPDDFDDSVAPSPAATESSLEQAELALIRRAVDESGGNISKASKRLGISRNTIYRKLRWNLPH